MHQTGTAVVFFVFERLNSHAFRQELKVFTERYPDVILLRWGKNAIALIASQTLVVEAAGSLAKHARTAQIKIVKQRTPYPLEDAMSWAVLGELWRLIAALPTGPLPPAVVLPFGVRARVHNRAPAFFITSLDKRLYFCILVG